MRLSAGCALTRATTTAGHHWRVSSRYRKIARQHAHTTTRNTSVLAVRNGVMKTPANMRTSATVSGAERFGRRYMRPLCGTSATCVTFLTGYGNCLRPGPQVRLVSTPEKLGVPAGGADG